MLICAALMCGMMLWMFFQTFPVLPVAGFGLNAATWTDVFLPVPVWLGSLFLKWGSFNSGRLHPSQFVKMRMQS